jgi:hypothetical protein
MCMRAIFINSYAVPKTRIKRLELLAEQGKYQLRLQRSPCQHKETADHNQAKQEDGTLDRRPVCRGSTSIVVTAIKGHSADSS